MSDQPLQLDVLAESRQERLVAAEPNPDGTATLFRRTADGTVEHETVPFHPWLLVAGRELGESVPGACARQSLAGAGAFDTRLEFADLPAYEAAVRFLKEHTRRAPTAADAPYRVFSDLGNQLLARLPARLFRGMAFPELRRLQVDIETRTSPGYDFPNAERADDAILLIALRDSSGWEASLSAADLPEAELLQRFVRLVQERDPDVIEGHNLFNFDLPYIRARARRHRISLALGRQGRPLSARASRFTAGDRTTAYTRFDIPGRHVVDTLHLVQLYDVSHRDLESFGLKAVARHFGVAARDRTYLPAERISETFAADPATVRDYAMDDVRETDAISRLLSPSYFYQAQLVPFSYQNCVTRGNAARIDALLTAAYLARDTALPRPQPPRPFQGALTEAVKSGVFRNVWHVDVASLYPSIILAFGLVPAADSLQLFPRMLAELRRFRLQAKESARRADPAGAREHWNALQSSFKILINSFYGYAGFSQATFNDFDLAETVTRNGREILAGMLAFLEREGAEVIEMDTDGIYFVPPRAVAEPAALLARLQATLPPGIEVELDATYAAMFSYKSKNYALLAPDGRVSVTGAALKSRGLEPFQRRLTLELVTLLLDGRTGEAGKLRRRAAEAIRTHQWPLSDFAQREVLSTSPATYQEKLAKGETRRSAAYELALRAGRRYEQGDTVAFYITGEKKTISVSDGAKLLADAPADRRDENVPYYLDKLDKLFAKFAEFLPEDREVELT
jgi:DNA polymerase elongation subunit (family B)